MHQPELGQRLTALRKEKNLTQEELVEKSRVSVRTIQRIEAGEVLPRIYTVRILLEALGEDPDSFLAKSNQVMEPKTTSVLKMNPDVLLAAALSGVVYLILSVVLSVMDVAWLVGERDWSTNLNAIYTGLSILMALSFAVFAWGFIVLANLFENKLLKAVSFILIVAVAAEAALDITSLAVDSVQSLWPYAVSSVLFGSISIVFGVALIRLQDGMGELSRIAGLLEIVTGALLITVVLFFLAYVVFIPAVVMEILVLYRGYEYLSKPAPAQAGNA